MSSSSRGTYEDDTHSVRSQAPLNSPSSSGLICCLKISTPFSKQLDWNSIQTRFIRCDRMLTCDTVWKEKRAISKMQQFLHWLALEVPATSTNSGQFYQLIFVKIPGPETTVICQNSLFLLFYFISVVQLVVSVFPVAAATKVTLNDNSLKMTDSSQSTTV